MTQPAFTLNGIEVPFEAGQTILEAARQAGIFIPTLCDYKDTIPTGACRVCVVEMEGARTLVPACATPATPGAVVRSDTERVESSRRLVLELMLASGNHNCLICEANGQCELQDLAYRYQVDFPAFVRDSGETFYYEDNNSMIIRDNSKCILCHRCVRACNERQVNLALGVGYRGGESAIVARGDQPYIESECVFCGECVQACPTAALLDKNARYQGRPWEIERVRSTCTYCGVGCQIDIHTRNNRIIKVTGADAIPNRGRLCVKGRFGWHFVHHPDRLKTPLIKENGEFRRASWEEALDLVARRLREIKEEHGPEKIGGWCSARITNEENYLMQKFLRAVIGTNHVDHCARLCHSATVAGLAASFGSGAMTNSIEELEESDCILVTGSNTSETHPVIASFIKRAVRLKGKTLIVIDPRRLYLTRHAAVWLRQRPGSDAAVLNGLMHVIIRDNLHDRAYIAERTENFEAFKETVARYTPEVVELISGVPAKDLEKAAHLYATAPRAAICYAMGITQHITGTDNVKCLANLAMLCGNVGIRGGGVNPLRGQNNVQGACDMGGLPNVFSGYKPVTIPENRWKMERVWGVRNLPDWEGMTMTEMLPAISEGKIKALYIIGENPVISEADAQHAINPLQELDFLVVQDLFLTETGKVADVVLPASSFAEKNGTFTNTERRVLLVRRAVLPVRNSLPDWRIICELSQRLDYPMDYTTPQEIFEEIRQVTPAYAGISYERLEREGGLQWPCPHPDHPGTRYLHKDRFTRGRGHFSPIDYREPAELPDEEYPLILTTGRVLYQYHTGTMSRRAPGLVEKAPECRVEIAAGDADRFGIHDGEMVWVKSRRGQIRARALVSTKAIPGTIFVPFHYYEAAVNKLTIAALDPVAKIPAYKVCAVKLEKIGESPEEKAPADAPLREGVAS